jgi:hypothetical protein
MIVANALTKRRGDRTVVSDVGACRDVTRSLDAASAADRHLADLTTGGGFVKAFNPTAVIARREALTGSTRATRIRDLTIPAWLSIRTRP